MGGALYQDELMDKGTSEVEMLSSQHFFWIRFVLSPKF